MKNTIMNLIKEQGTTVATIECRKALQNGKITMEEFREIADAIMKCYTKD